MPYYFGWKMSEVSCIIAGIGYSGDDAKGAQPRRVSRLMCGSHAQPSCVYIYRQSGVESLLQRQRDSGRECDEHQKRHRFVELGDRSLAQVTQSQRSLDRTSDVQRAFPTLSSPLDITFMLEFKRRNTRRTMCTSRCWSAPSGTVSILAITCKAAMVRSVEKTPNDYDVLRNAYRRSFLTAAIIIHVARLARRVCRPRFMEAVCLVSRRCCCCYRNVAFCSYFW